MTSSSPKSLSFVHTAVAVSQTGDDLLKRLSDPKLSGELSVAMPILTGLLLVFGIETGFKALLEDVEGTLITKKSGLRVHNLTTLWDALSPDTQQAVQDRVFAHCTLQNTEVPRVAGLLEWHQGSFENWRYWEPTRYTDADGTVRKTGGTVDIDILGGVLRVVVEVHMAACGSPYTTIPEPRPEQLPEELARAAYRYRQLAYPDDPRSALTFADWYAENVDTVTLPRQPLGLTA